MECIKGQQKDIHLFMEPSMKPINFVAKHMNDFNRSTVEVDRKKKSKGTDRKTKHKVKYV